MTHSSHAPLSVLIIDDNTTLLEDYKTYFEQSGLTVHTAENAESGLKVAESYQPSIILLDLMMPGVNGIDALKSLKSNEKTAAIPVVVITALVNDAEKNESLKAGAEEYIEKVESEPAQILSTIRRVVRHSHS